MTTVKKKHNVNNKIKTKTKTKTRKNNKTYTNKDFKSNDGMITNVWGPALWHYLHTMSFNYPVHPTIEEKRHYRNFIISLRHVLPCKYCRINLKTNFKQLPITMADMKNRETFSRYIYNLHELINKMLNKKSNLSYCDVRERYEHFRSRCTDEKPKIFKFSNFTRKKEKGCTEPLYGKKSKCIINIVPQNIKGETIQIDKSCIKHR
jgi:hypothetical protein